MRIIQLRGAGAWRGATVLITTLTGFLAAACSGGNASRPGDSALSSAAEDKPAIMRAVDGIPGWTRTGGVETYTKDGLYGYIDGGAEIVLQYGFRELAVFKFKPAAATAPALPGPGLGSPALPAQKELVLEIYRMDSGEAAFGIFSTKLEGEEEGWPGIKSDHWVGPGQGGLAKGEYMVNILSPESTDREIGDFAAAIELKIPGKGTARPKGMDWLPRAGMVARSGRYIKGPLAAQNESPFLEAAFWGFGAKNGATEAYSAKYGVAPAVSKLVIVKFEKAPAAGVLEDSVLAVFKEYLMEVRQEGEIIEGKNDVGRWFLFKRADAIAVLVLSEPDRNLARARLNLARAIAGYREDGALPGSLDTVHPLGPMEMPPAPKYARGDLAGPAPFREISLSTLSDQRSWILHPASVACSVSADGASFREAGVIVAEGDHRGEDVTRPFVWKGPFDGTRYVRFRVVGTKRLPDWHPSAGGASWVFVDEIVVR